LKEGQDMKKIVYAILACIIVVGAILTLTMGLRVDIIYSKNVEIDVYVGKVVDIKEIEEIAKEVFSNEKMIIQKIELFEDMVSITMPEKSDEELKEQIEQLNTKINEKYETKNTVEDSITIIHNPKIKLSSILKPYIMPVTISIAIILVYVGIRYKKLGMMKTIGSYILYTAIVEAVYLSIIAITRFPINRLVIPFGLVLYMTTITALSFNNEKKLAEKIEEETKKK